MLASDDAFAVIKDRMDRGRTPLGSVPLSSAFGFDYPLVSSRAFSSFDETSRDLSSAVDDLVRNTRAMSEARTVGSDLWPLPRRPIRARSVSPVREEVSHWTLPTRSLNYWRSFRPSGVNSTAISYPSSSPWSTTGFYYAPRYPQSWRGTASTVSPYLYGSRYYDYGLLNPFRFEYFKYPRYYKNYGPLPYKFPYPYMRSLHAKFW